MKILYLYPILGIATLLYFAVPSYAEVIPLITEMQKIYATIQNFSATFTQELIHQESGSQETRQGTLNFKKPLLIRWETMPPHEELLLINESAVWDYIPDEKLAYKYSTDIINDSTSIIQVITGQTRLDKNFTIIFERNDKEFSILKLYPKEPTTQMVEALLWLNKKTKLIHKIQSTDFYGNTNTITFIKIKPNIHINNKLFQFTPSKDITVENLQHQPIPERPLFN